MRQFADMPHRIKALPVDRRGYPVPWFVPWEDGEPLFPVADPVKLAMAILHSKCSMCGQTLGAFKCFVIGPMCVVNRVSAEPPCHRDCAEFAVKTCPFMTMPLAKRTSDRIAGIEDPAGIMIERNPGVSAIWVTK